MRMFLLAVCLFFATSTTACMKVTLQGPNGMEELIPLRKSINLQVYNNCAPILKVSGRHHVVEIPLGSTAKVFLPAVPGENNDQQEVVFMVMTSDRRLLGVGRNTFYPDYNSSVTEKKWVVGAGGSDQSLSGSQGQNICQQYGA